MPLRFTTQMLEYDEFASSVLVMADNDGQQVPVKIERLTLQVLGGSPMYSKDESILTLVRHQHRLEQATGSVMARKGHNGVPISITPEDLLD